jgi:hypothetical protein
VFPSCKSTAAASAGAISRMVPCGARCGEATLTSNDASSAMHSSE